MTTNNPDNWMRRIYLQCLLWGAGYSKVFVAGSVMRKIDDREECAAGVSVVLSQSGKTVGTTGTDDFGDFLFDGLDKFSGDYQLLFQQDGQPPVIKNVNIENSIVVEISI